MIALAGTGQTLLVTRAEWSARPPRYTTDFDADFGTTIHWEGPSMPDFHHGACASYVRGIQNFHMDSRGWADIAYTAVVCPHGYVFEGRWLGHRTGANGTNAGNDAAYAVCFLGGIGDPYTDEADRAMHDTTTHLRHHGAAGPGVNCHRDWKPTQCPGDVICSRVRSGRYHRDAQPSTPTPTPTPTPIPPEDDDMTKPLLVRISPKDPAVLFMSPASVVHWVRGPAHLTGYQAHMRMNGLSDAVCVLNDTDLKPLKDFIVNLPFIGDWPVNAQGQSTGTREAWVGPHIADDGP